MESLRRNELGESRKWEDLPSDCLANIFKRVGMKSLILLNVPFVCTTWYSASLNPNCWKNLDFSSFTTSVISEVPGMVNFAVNRSHFSATKFVIGNLFDNYKIDDVLNCISEGCPALKILKISPNTKLPSYTPQYIQKWKDLEFLCIGSQYHPPIFKELLEQISIHCKNFVGISTAILSYSSEEVSMIVAFIPNIKYLFLRGSYVARDDLILILSKCRDLVSLDVRDCIGFDSDDAEITQMASHITNFMCQGSDLFIDDEPDENYIDHDPIVYEGNSSSSIGFHFDDAALTRMDSIITTFVSGFSFSDDDDDGPMVYDGNLSS